MSEAKRTIAKRFLIRGRVQGVGFRYFTDRCATELGIFGYVKNLWDGSVEVYAVGTESAVEDLKRQLAEGPRSSRVTSVDESDERVDERYRRFIIEDGV
jgi:acylphosphatase